MEYHGPIPGESLAARERGERREARRICKARGLPYPHLRTIGHVEVPSGVPDWSIAWAVPGLTLTDTAIWLGKKYARKMAKLLTERGVPHRVTWTAWRPCKICKRILLGIEAEHRWQLDRKFEGHRIPCSPECTELQWDRIDARVKSSAKVNDAPRKGKRHAGSQLQ